MCFYPLSQTPRARGCSYTGSKASTSRRTSSGLKVEAVDQLWNMCKAPPCSSAPLRQATRQKRACNRASPAWLSPIQRISRGTRSLLHLTSPESCLDLQATSLLRRRSVSSCVIAISCSILILPNKQDQLSRSFKPAPSQFSSTQPAQSLEAGQMHPAICPGKPHLTRDTKVSVIS